MADTTSIIAALAPVKRFLKRFTYVLLVSAAAGLMLIGKVETVVIETIRVRLADTVAPLLDAAWAPANLVATMVEHVGEIASLREENVRLREQNGKMLQWQLLAQRLNSENKSLRELLNFHPGPSAAYISARVLADTGGAFVRTLLINAGSAAGVRKGQAVISGDGLVGRVAAIGEQTARVLLITDLNSRIPVVVGEERKRAVLAGDNGENPRLIHAKPDETLEPGELILTSGEGGLFRAGLPIGVVAGADGRTVAAQTFVNWDRLELVRVVDYGPEGTVDAALH